jgi:hypothetical protein
LVEADVRKMQETLGPEIKELGVKVSDGMDELEEHIEVH